MLAVKLMRACMQPRATVRRGGGAAKEPPRKLGGPVSFCAQSPRDEGKLPWEIPPTSHSPATRSTRGQGGRGWLFGVESVELDHDLPTKQTAGGSTTTGMACNIKQPFCLLLG